MLVITGIAIAYVVAALYQVWRTEGSRSRWLDLGVVFLCAELVQVRARPEMLLVSALMLWLVCSARRYAIRRKPCVPGCRRVARQTAP